MCVIFKVIKCLDNVIVMVSDKPVPTRAWASLPTAFLHITKGTLSTDGELNEFYIILFMIRESTIVT